MPVQRIYSLIFIGASAIAPTVKASLEKHKLPTVFCLPQVPVSGWLVQGCIPLFYPMWSQRVRGSQRNIKVIGGIAVEKVRGKKGGIKVQDC